MTTTTMLEAPHLLPSVEPIRMSLVEGTDIPAPEPSPPQTPLARPPTPGGGPLSSHPATPPSKRSTPPSSMTKSSSPPAAKKSPTPAITSTPIRPTKREPLTPSSANKQNLPQRRDSSGVRKLLSLSSLRNSFGGSRTSLSLQTSPSSGRGSPSETKPRPSTSSRISHHGLNSVPTYQTYQASVTSASSNSVGIGNENKAPQLRKRKSGSWFRRQSQLFLPGGNTDEWGLSSVQENLGRDAGSRPETADKVLRISSPILIAPADEKDVTPPPVLPDVDFLKGGRLTDGGFVSDDVFADIGR